MLSGRHLLAVTSLGRGGGVYSEGMPAAVSSEKDPNPTGPRVYSYNLI